MSFTQFGYSASSSANSGGGASQNSFGNSTTAVSASQLLSSGGSTGGHSSISPGSPGSANNITSPVPPAPTDRLTSSLSPAGAQVSPAIGSPATVASPATTASGVVPPASTDPVTGQLLADCDRLAALSYPRFGPMYSASYPSTDQNPYPSIAMENTFYGSLGNPYMKDGNGDMSAWSASAAALPPTAGYYSYDHPTLAAYGYGGGYDLAARRKNATRESTATLKAWLNEHKKNPYPTKGEKIMLAIITKMTLTQVSTWFANARRRLKKENKMTWEPKNKIDDEDVEVSDDDEREREDDKHDGPHLTRSGDDLKDSDKSGGIPIPPSKPKIWSLADTAVCKTPPPSQSSQHNQSSGVHWGGLGASNQYQFMGHHSASAMSALRSANMFGHFGAGGQSSDLSTDTPPHTPPNVKTSAAVAAAAAAQHSALGGLMQGFGGGSYNGVGGYQHQDGKLLSFQSSNMNNAAAGAFKMM